MSAPAPAPIPTLENAATITTVRQLLALLLRCFIGYGVMFGCLLLLLRRPAWTYSAVDIVYWLVLVAVVLLHRTSSRGEERIARWRRVALQHLVVAAALWALCQSVQAIP